MYDVLIIGCGVTGAALAYELSRYQLKTAVIERENDVAMGATKANSAILHAGYDPLSGTLMGQLNVRGSARALEICQALGVPVRQCGSLVIGFTPEDRTILEELLRRGRENGVPDLRMLTGGEARGLEPNLSPAVTCALHAPTAAICSPWSYCLAMMEQAVLRGTGLFLEREVQGLERLPAGWQVQTSQGPLESRLIVNAAGVFSGRIHNMAAPHTWSISPSRGQYYLLDKSEGARVSHIIFQCPGTSGKGVLVAPTVHGNLIVGPSAEPVEGEDTATTTAGLDFVRAAALKSVPSIDFRASIRNFSGVRARASTGDFILGEDPEAPGLFHAAGICSPGLSAAAAIAEHLTAALEASGLSLTARETLPELTPHPLPFRALSPAEKAALVARDPAYGRVICRCETVTEGEILSALHGPIPPRSLDGVKRRTNAGMGRCQSGFCGPRVAELLCRELGITPDQVLQDQKGTQLLIEPTKGRCPRDAR
ncbi:MAG: NAD(P)/FAD-dependent oxidoreductase [Oscillospiraceae bacterium]|nr:NAD(P)/FAD-dependent oxidoreductase [Oscillospiraceae bacterium]